MIHVSRRIVISALLLLVAVASVYGLGRVAVRPPVDPAEAVKAKGGRVVYASVDGWSGGNGTIDKPVDLGTALSPNGPARPGDTVWLLAGTYRGNFVSNLNGAEAAPITIAPYPGARVTIDSSPSRDAALFVMGSWTTIMGIEVMNSDPSRISTVSGSTAADLRRGTGVELRGPHSKVINMVVHDLAGGFGIWSDAEGAEAYGNIVYYNGWTGNDRNHGHGIYAQNRTGVRKIEDNIIFNQVAYGVHIYGSEEAYLDNIELEGNVVFNNGLVNDKNYERNILFGGGRQAQNPIVRNNYTYYTPNLPRGSTSNRGERWGGENNIGYAAGCSNLLMEGNYFAHWGGGEALILTKCAGTIKNNVFYGLIGGDIQVRETYPDNSYLVARPQGAKVFVRPNKYQAGRANVIVYNWDQNEQVTADLSTSGLTKGAWFEVRDAQNFFGQPVFSGRFDGSPIKLSMSGLTVTPPIGNLPQHPAHTAPEFAVFVVVPAAEPAGLWSRLRGRAARLFSLRASAPGVTEAAQPQRPIV